MTSKLLKSKATNTPFLGTALTSWPIMNIHNGIIHHLNEEGA
ncbi:hypothetical protein ACOBWH_05690 [Spiroplasma endosymbiont of Glossina fuscipes fuscipes]